MFAMNPGGIGESFDNWLTSPFSSDMSVLKWALFVGLILVACLGWSRIIRLILDNA
jgi:hypothetical protein